MPDHCQASADQWLLQVSKASVQELERESLTLLHARDRLHID